MVNRGSLLGSGDGSDSRLVTTTILRISLTGVTYLSTRYSHHRESIRIGSSLRWEVLVRGTSAFIRTVGKILLPGLIDPLATTSTTIPREDRESIRLGGRVHAKKFTCPKSLVYRCGHYVPVGVRLVRMCPRNTGCCHQPERQRGSRSGRSRTQDRRTETGRVPGTQLKREVCLEGKASCSPEERERSGFIEQESL